MHSGGSFLLTALADLKCEASLGVALGYRDLRPPMIGTCERPYERLLHDLRGNWTEPLGRQAVEAVKSLRASVDALEAELSRDPPQFADLIRPARLDDIRSHLRPGELLIEFVQ